MRYSKWIALVSCVLLIVTCFIPWTYHADVQKNFTGFFSEKNAYGSPGKYFIFFAVLSILLLLLEKVWSQRALFFVGGLMVAFAIKTYILFTSCYNAYCPEKKLGIFLVLGLSLLIFTMFLFPDIKLKTDKKEEL